MKFCPRCKIEKSLDKFYKNPKTKDGLRSWCKLCCNKDNSKREPKYKEYRKLYRTSKNGINIHKKAKRKYRDTIKGHLAQVYCDLDTRCTNSNCASFENYGGRGIKNKFKSLNAFRNYVMNKLQINPHGLQIDRINNNGHYEIGNIRFVTCAENLSNRRNTK